MFGVSVKNGKEGLFSGEVQMHHYGVLAFRIEGTLYLDRGKSMFLKKALGRLIVDSRMEDQGFEP